MNIDEIRHILDKFASFGGAFSPENLPEIDRYPQGFVITTKPFDSPSNHATAVFFESKHYVEYFDPTGLPPVNDHVIAWMRKYGAIIRHSNARLQMFEDEGFTDSCGPMSIIFLALKDDGFEMEEIISYFATRDKACNDKIAWAMMKLIRNPRYNS